VQRPSSLYKRHRYPGEIISRAVWRYFRFLLSYRDVEELLAERGIALSYETIRQWCRKLGEPFAVGARRRRPRPGDKWHLVEVQLKGNGRKHWLWRAVDQAGIVLDILVQVRRNQEAAETFLRRVLDGNDYQRVLDGNDYQPRVVVTDTLASYPPALRRVLSGVEHRRHKGLNNRAENSHRPTRRRERVLQRFRSPAHAQPFLSPFGPISDHFRPRRHLLLAPAYHQLLQTRFATWRQVTGVAAPAYHTLLQTLFTSWREATGLAAA
jgi:putative transposase